MEKLVTIKYKINNKGKIRLFGNEFVKNNINDCKMIIKGKTNKLDEFCDTSKIQNKELEIKLIGIEKINNMSFMFRECESLISLSYISKMVTSKIIDISYIFSECKSLSYLPDISKWDTSKVTNMNSMFKLCKSLSILPDIGKWDISSVKDISEMFDYCKSLCFLPNINNWNIINIKGSRESFNGCLSLSYLPDISNWNNSKNISIGLDDINYLQKSSL